jgi:hypothetical protein
MSELGSGTVAAKLVPMRSVSTLMLAALSFPVTVRV